MNDHYNKYEALAQKIGIDALVKLMPVNKIEMQKCLDQDEHLNNIPLHVWDRKAGLLSDGKTTFNLAFYAPWTPELAKGLSLAERVCTLKHVAKYHYATKED
jgi:hypothetical protein